jgi:hypothetical protein
MPTADDTSEFVRFLKGPPPTPPEELMIVPPLRGIEFTEPVVLTGVETTPVKSTPAYPTRVRKDADPANSPLDSANTNQLIETTPVQTTGVPSTGEQRSNPALPLAEVQLFEGIRGRRVIRQARSVQDGHTRTEQEILTRLWTHPRCQIVNRDCRRVTIGFGELARLVGIKESKNAKLAVRSLIGKLALEEQGWNYVTGTTFLVFSFDEILRRRAAARLTHVICHRGVTFVDPITGKALKTTGVKTTGVVKNGVEVVNTGPVKTTESTGVKTTPLFNKPSVKNFSLRKPTSTVAPTIVAALIQHFGKADDTAAQTILAACRTQAPDIMESEIETLIHEEAPLMIRNRSIENPMGLLIRHLPRRCAGESFQQWRQGREAELQRERHRQEEFLQYWRDVRDSATSSNEERLEAQRILSSTSFERR